MKIKATPELKEVPISKPDLVTVLNEIADHLFEMSHHQGGSKDEILSHLQGYSRGIKMFVSSRSWFIPSGEQL